MNDERRTEMQADGQDRVIVVGAGPVGCTAALLLADYGVPVTLLERRTEPHPLPAPSTWTTRSRGFWGAWA